MPTPWVDVVLVLAVPALWLAVALIGLAMVIGGNVRRYRARRSRR